MFNYRDYIMPREKVDGEFDILDSVPFWETSPACKSYWQIISQISARNKIDLKTAVSLYRKLTGEPSKARYIILMNTPNDMLYSCNNTIIITKDEDKLIDYGLQPYHAGEVDKIVSIDIDISCRKECGIYYILEHNSAFWFSPELLDVLK